MTTRIIINGREVTSPAARAIITAIMLSMIAGLLALLLFVLLPLVGVIVGLGLGAAAIGLGTLGLGLPLLRRRASISRRLTGAPPADRLLPEHDRDRDR
jgi:hypothetical protein